MTARKTKKMINLKLTKTIEKAFEIKEEHFGQKNNYIYV